MPRPQFAKGNKIAKGGPRPGSGRPPDWFKKRMQGIASRKEAIKFVEDVVLGKEVDEFITPNGECIPHRAKAEVRFKVWADTADRGFGRATQAIEMTGDVRVNLINAIKEAREQRRLDR